MKVALVHTQALGTREAGIAFVTGAATGLAQAGAETALLVPHGEADPHAALRELGVPMPPPFALPRLPAVRLHLGPFHPSWGERFRKAVARTVREGRFDAVIVRDLKLAQALGGRKRAAKVILEMHSVYTLGQDDDEAQRLFPAKKLEAHRALVATEAEVLMAADGVIALTDGLAALLRPLFGLEDRVIAAGSALHPGAPPQKQPHPTDIAYIGSLDPHKGVGLIVEALPHLPPEVRLRIVGHGRHLEALSEQAARLGVADRLVEAGWFTPAELPAALAGCFAAAVPLEDCFYNRFVTSPMKAFDYARAGVVPVVPRLPVFGELFGAGEGAVFVTPGDPAAYREALLRLYQDAAFRAQKENELAAFAARHTWRARGEKLLPWLSALPRR